MIARASRLLLASGFLAAVAHVAPVAEMASLGITRVEDLVIAGFLLHTIEIKHRTNMRASAASFMSTALKTIFPFSSAA
jgi:hypothetical protein